MRRALYSGPMVQSKNCRNCGLLFTFHRTRINTAFYCSRKCRTDYESGARNPNWKGGIYVKEGRIYVRSKSHLAGKNGLAARARIVAEKAFRKRLTRDDHVHHKDENKTHDEPGNLKILSNSEHLKIHYRSRKIDEKGRLLPKG